jgi:hypothetical protein
MPKVWGQNEKFSSEACEIIFIPLLQNRGAALELNRLDDVKSAGWAVS